MIRYWLSLVIALISSAVFAEAGCKIGAVYGRVGSSGDEYQYGFTLPLTGDNGDVVASTPVQLMQIYYGHLMQSNFGSHLASGQIATSGLSSSSGFIDIGGVSCPVSIWSVRFFYVADPSQTVNTAMAYAFPTANVDSGSGSGGEFGKFYTPSGETFNTVISDFRGRVQEGSLFKAIKDWFVLSAIVSACPRYEYRVPIFDKTVDISLASVFCSETSDKLFSMAKTIMLVGVAAIGIRIAFT